MEKVDYDARLHAVYAVGRQMSPDALQTWTEAFARHLPETRPLVWLDLGSGTGRMTPSLASAFGGPAHGVEPSDRMRAQALARAGHPAATYVAGSGEHIPLPEASCDAALLFFVWHHVVDREAAARELHRVVKPGGTLFVGGISPTRCPMSGGSGSCPNGGTSTRRNFGPRKTQGVIFVDAGWTPVSCDEVTWLRSATLTEDFERLKLRAVSFFEYASDEVVEAGFAKVEAALPSLGDGPQYETSTLLVFQR